MAKSRKMAKSKMRWLVSCAAGALAIGGGAGTALASGGSGPTFTTPHDKAFVQLAAMPTGSVSFHRNGTTREATISATGLTPGSTHVAEITSLRNHTPILFTQFTANATGQVQTTVSSVGPVRRLPDDSTFQIDLSTSPGQPIAVAPARVFPFGKTVPLHAIETGGRGPLTGHATLSYNRQTKSLTVSVHATGFVPNTSHAAHVHAGSCTVQGPVLNMLQDLHANGYGEINQTQVVPNVNSPTAPAGGWYLNIHEGPGAAILDAQGNPTPQFRPLLCANLPASVPANPVQEHQPPPPAPWNTQGMNGTNGYGSQPGTPSAPAQPAAPAPTNTQGTNGYGSQPSTVSPPSTGYQGQPAPTPVPHLGTGHGWGANVPPTTTPGTMPPAPPTTMAPAPNGGGTTVAQPKSFNVTLAPLGPSQGTGTAVVTLNPATNQVSVTANLSGFNSSSVAAEITHDDNDAVVSFSLNAASPGQSFQGSAPLSAFWIQQIPRIPGVFKLRVSAPGGPLQILQGQLRAQS